MVVDVHGKESDIRSPSHVTTELFEMKDASFQDYQWVSGASGTASASMFPFPGPRSLVIEAKPWSPEPDAPESRAAPLALAISCAEEEQASHTEQESLRKVLPVLDGTDLHDSVLTDRVWRLLHVLWSIVVSRASQARFPLRKTAVTVFADPEEGNRKAVLRVTCNATASQTFAFWDSLEPDFQGWLERLNEHDRDTFLVKIDLRMHWR